MDVPAVQRRLYQDVRIMLSKWCRIHGKYDFGYTRCPKCRNASKSRLNASRMASHERGYSNDWRSFRKRVMADPVYSYSWLAFHETGKLVPAELLHHIMSVAEYPEKRLVKSNVVPLTVKEHSELEVKIRKGIPQPNWDIYRMELENHFNSSLNKK